MDRRRPSDVLAAFFLAALAMLLAAALAGAVHAASGEPSLRWLALHLAFVGGVSQLVLGAAQFFVCAFLATTPTPRRLVWAQLATWNAGTVLIAVGVPAGATPASAAGGALVVTGLVLFAAALRGLQRRSLQRARWAVRWYQAGAACLALGALIGIALAAGAPWTHGSLLGAHLALNLGGWFGTAIVGTLHTLFPSLTQTQLRHPRLQGPAFALWLLGIADLTAGAAFDIAPLVASGWLELAAAAALLGVNLVASLRAAPVPPALPARLIAAGQAFLPAGLLLALAATVTDGAAAAFAGTVRGALATLLVAGWIGLTVAGSLLHLLAILARVRRFSLALPAARPARDRAIAGAAALAVSALALSHAAALGALAAPATAALLAVAAFLGVRIAVLAARAAQAAAGAGTSTSIPIPSRGSGTARSRRDAR